MFNKIQSLLRTANIVSDDVVKKGLQKVEPRLKKFFSESSKYGYPLGAAIGFLQSELNGRNQAPVDRSIRPDQAANQEIKRQESLPGQLIGSAANIAAGAGLGGLGGAAISGISGLLNEPQQSQPKQEPISEPGPREQALKRHAEMNKKKKMIDQLTEDFEKEYGQGNIPTTRIPGVSAGSSSNERIQQGTPGGEKSELLRALQETKRLLGG